VGQPSTDTRALGQDLVDRIEQALEHGFEHIGAWPAQLSRIPTVTYLQTPHSRIKIENEVGKAVADSGLARDDLWITSKVRTYV